MDKRNFNPSRQGVALFTFCPLGERGNKSADDFTPETNHQMIPEYLNVVGSN